EVLKGVDLRVDPGELVFVIGPSGAGKSTLLRCCNRLEEPTSGSIKVEGVDILAPGVDINAIRRRIGMVFQSFNLYPHLDALGNVTLALQRVLKKSRSEAKDIGAAALQRVGLAEKAKAYPNELSGGQQQRVAIARALALEPASLMFDEPTSALALAVVIAGIACGLFLSVLRAFRFRAVNFLIVFAVDVLRALPPLVIIIAFYFALPTVGLRMSAWVSTWLALSLVLMAFSEE